MKKYILGIALVSLCFACSQDEETLNNPESNLETSFEVTIVDPVTATPNKAFDLAGAGLYQGIIVTEDAQFHGKIFVNVGNDGNYNALVETDTRERVSFKGKPLNRTNTLFQFEGKRGSFVYDVTNYDSPVASEVVIDNTNGFVQTVKDRSEQRAATTLGTYVDFADPAFAGTWDLISDGTPVPDAFGLPALTQVCILGPGGAMFIDDVFDTFEYPCFTLPGPVSPVFHLAGGPFGSINEFWAQNQSVDIAGITMDYFLGQSTSVHGANPTFENPGFHNNNFADPPTPGCNVFTGGLQGIWFWNGRVGSGTFFDPFAPPPPPPANAVGEATGISNPVQITNIPTLQK